MHWSYRNVVLSDGDHHIPMFKCKKPEHKLLWELFTEAQVGERERSEADQQDYSNVPGSTGVET